MAKRLALAVSTTVIATLGVLLPAPAHASELSTANSLRGTSWELATPGMHRGTSWE